MGRYEKIVTLEDGIVAGGFGSAVEEWIAANGYELPVVSLGIKDPWVMQGTVAELRHDCGYDAASIVELLS